VTLARAWRAEKEGILSTANKATRREVKDQAAIDLFVEVEIKVVERLMRVTEAGLLSPPLEKPVASPSQLVRDQAGDEINRRHGLGLSLTKARLEHRRHTTKP